MTQAALAESLALVARARANLVQTAMTIARVREECEEIRRHLASPQFKPVVIGTDRCPEAQKPRSPEAQKPGCSDDL
jgi:hypothetical protein